MGIVLQSPPQQQHGKGSAAAAPAALAASEADIDVQEGFCAVWMGQLRLVHSTYCVSAQLQLL
jgi:hypothetical protein